MKPTLIGRLAFYLVGIYPIFGSALRASPVEYTFTGTGIHGSVAVGSFVAEDNLAPFYFATGGIYSDFSLTITSIPGSGPSSVTFDLADLGSSWLNVDGSGTVYIAPYGSHNYGAPFYDHYDLGQPSQPGYPGSFAFETILYFDGEHGYRDTITWSAATVAPSAVPESGSTLIFLLGAGVTLVAASARRAISR